MEELIEKVENTLEERNICIPEDYDIKDVLVDYDSIDITDEIFEEIIGKFKNISLVCELLSKYDIDFVEFSKNLTEMILNFRIIIILEISWKDLIVVNYPMKI